ncbi:MAG: hypothetical protein WA733_11630, partial [Methylocystis sp.]
DRLLTGLHDACAAFPDKRKGAGGYSMADIGLSAFSLFFMQSESFRAKRRERRVQMAGNLATSRSEGRFRSAVRHPELRRRSPRPRGLSQACQMSQNAP